MIRNILVPIDGSPDADTALDHAIELARENNAEIVLMCVEPSASPLATRGVWGVTPDMAEAERENDRFYHRVLDAASERIPDDVAFKRVLTEGDPGAKIVSQAEDGNYDMVVMGSRGLGRVVGLLLGSVSRHVVSRLRMPVVIVHAGAAEVRHAARDTQGDDAPATA